MRLIRRRLHHQSGVAAGRNFFHIDSIVSDFHNTETAEQSFAFGNDEYVVTICKESLFSAGLGIGDVSEKSGRNFERRRRRRAVAGAADAARDDSDRPSAQAEAELPG